MIEGTRNALRPLARPIPLVLIFAIFLAGLLAVLSQWKRPEGVHRIYTEPIERTLKISKDAPIEIDFTLPVAEGIRGFRFRTESIGQFNAVAVTVRKGGQIVASGRLLKDRPARIAVQQPELLADGDQLTMRLELADLKPPKVEAVAIGYGGEKPAAAEFAQTPFELREGEAVAFEFEASRANLNTLGIRVSHFEGELSRVRVRLENLTVGREITKLVFKPSGNEELRKIEGGNAAGDRMRLKFERAVSGDPKIRLAAETPPDFETRRAGTVVDAAPLFVPFYDLPGQDLTIWLWLALLAALAAALRWEEFTPLFLIASGLVAVLTSYQAWLHLCTIFEPFRDMDNYGEYGAGMWNWLTTPSSRPEFEAFLESYAHAQSPLVPLLIAIGVSLGLSSTGAYLFIAGLSAFGVLVCVHHLLRRQLGFSNAVALAGIILLIANITFLRIFARPGTDMPGVLLNILVWPVLIARFREPRTWQLLALAGLVLAIALARPPGPSFIAYIVAATIAVDWIRERRFDFVSHFKVGLVVCLPPVLIFAGLFFAFGWSENLAIGVEKSKSYHFARTSENLENCALVVLNVLPVFWLMIREKQPWRLTALLVVSAWLAFYLGMIAIVKAPFMHRLFLPIVPAVVVLTCFGFERLVRWRAWTRWIFVAFAILFAAVNLALLAEQMSEDNYLDLMWLPN